ncbi:MAG: response regulator [Kiritimatiellaeota bacterium]|nr:response regulator [Kiritimatiellota bacterium]
MKAKRDILVIDDEAVVVEGVARICGFQGLSVDTADNGAAGLEQLDRYAYRLVLCDVMMQTLDGFQYLAEAARRSSRTPVIMITGYATVENAVHSLLCGAIDFIAKPFTVDELLAVVQRGLNYGRLVEEEAPAAGAPSPRTNGPTPHYRLGPVSWAAIEPAGTALIGVSDVFVRTIDGVQRVDLSSAGSELVQGNSCAAISSTNALVHSVMCPLSGRVLDANARVIAHPDILASGPYADGWLYRILPSDLKYNLRWLQAGEASPGRGDFR